jgi:hypothetical protein
MTAAGMLSIQGANMPSPSALVWALLVGAASLWIPDLVRAQAAGEVSLSDESLQLRYLTPASLGAAGDGEVGFGVFLNEDRDLILSGHYFVEADRLGGRRLVIKGGPIAYGALLGEENMDVFSIALAAEARFELLRRQEVFLVARFAYAPDILTFGTADSLTDFTGEVEAALTDRVSGLIGYRLFEFDLLEGEREVEESVHLGIRYEF